MESVKQWPSERPLFIAVLVTSLVIWTVLVLSKVGMIYAAVLGAFFFFGHVAFIAHLRGSSICLSEQQFPELYRRVQELAEQIGLDPRPEVYIMESGGGLNAFATKFFLTQFVVLNADLLRACGNNTQARDMIIAHELGHLHARHLQWRWFLLPGLFMPILGNAYSRACEYTCDRYGMSVCTDKKAALRGLTILAGGAEYGATLDVQHFVEQSKDLSGFWMWVGRCMSTHPPLAYRVKALQPELSEDLFLRRARVGGAMAWLFSVLLVITVSFVAYEQASNIM